MNCIGPTARSCTGRRPTCRCRCRVMSAKPLPSSTGPRIGLHVVPFASTAPPRAWPDSTWPMAASSCHGRWQPGLALRDRLLRALVGGQHGRRQARAAAGTVTVAPPARRRGSARAGPGRVERRQRVMYGEPPSICEPGRRVGACCRLRRRVGHRQEPGACEAPSAAIAAAATAVPAAPLRTFRAVPPRCHIGVPPKARCAPVPARQLGDPTATSSPTTVPRQSTGFETPDSPWSPRGHHRHRPGWPPLTAEPCGPVASTTVTAGSGQRGTSAWRRVTQCAADSQSVPTPTETSSGARSGYAVAISRRTSSSTCARSPGRPRARFRRAPGAASGSASTAPQRLVDPQHRDLHDVRGRTLDRRVERHPLGHLAALPVVAVEVRQIAAAAQQRLGVAGDAGLLDHPVQIVPHPAEPLEVRLHERAGLGRLDTELLGQPERGQAVRQPVRHRLDLAAHLGVDASRARRTPASRPWCGGPHRR